MHYIGETISLIVAFSWTISAVCAEVASKRIGTLQLNVIRLILSLIFLGVTMYVVTGSPLPLYADGKAWLWLSLSGFVGYVLGDYCLFNSYLLIGSRFGQLFMTLAPLAAAISGWILLGERLSMQAWLGMFVTMSGISISILNRGKEKGHKLELKLPVKGVLLGIGAGIGQGVGLVLSKMGMNYYELSIPEGMETIHSLVPFASTWVRALTGAICFLIVMYFQKEFYTLPIAFKNKKGMLAAVFTTISGPFIGVSLSLMAVKYTEAGIASTLMALTPIIILLPSYLFFKQKITWMEIVGAFISVFGVSLFFL